MKTEQEITVKLAKAKILLKQNMYRESLNILKSFDVSGYQNVEKGEYYLLVAENSLFLGEYHHDYIQKALDIYKSSPFHEQFARAKYLLGWQYQSLGKHTDANEAFIESYAAFLRIDNFSWAARVMNRLSYINLLTGNIEQAISNLNKSIHCYKKANNVKKYLISQNNLALVHFLNGSLKLSLSLYEDGMRKYDVLNNNNKFVFKLGLSIVTAITGNINKAYKLLEESYKLTHGYHREKSQYYEFKGLFLILDKKYNQAEKSLLKGLKIAIKIAPESDLVSQTKRLLADLYFATGEYDRAHKHASEALAVAEKINERVEIAACWRVFGQLEHRRGNDDKAREWFAKAVELFNQISSRYELAVTRYLAARDGLYYNGERIAALYMAREYFESEDIKHYVEKVDRELKKALAERPAPRLRRDTSDNGGCPAIITAGLPLKKLVTFAEHVAGSEMTVLLTGETGTGKDLFAKYIHYQSGRPGDFVVFNAAAVPNSMIESELFGYKKGAFTGADHDKPGLFEMADNGTFYLNEIADASLEFQVKLLEALESRTVRRLGENCPRKVNFRLIAASNHDLKELINENKFRLDLYHRLNEIPITLPPLSDRPDDFVPLVKFFLRDAGLNNGHKGIGRLAEILSQRIWPGNVRQLRTEINRLWLESQGNFTRLKELARTFNAATEREQLLQTLVSCEWNRREAARRLGVSETTVRRWIEKYDLAESFVE